MYGSSRSKPILSEKYIPKIYCSTFCIIELNLQPPVLRHNLMTVCAIISIMKNHAAIMHIYIVNFCLIISQSIENKINLLEKHRQQLQQPTYWYLYLNKPSPFSALSIRFTRRRWERRSMRDRQNHTQICF